MWWILYLFLLFMLRPTYEGALVGATVHDHGKHQEEGFKDLLWNAIHHPGKQRGREMADLRHQVLITVSPFFSAGPALAPAVEQTISPPSPSESSSVAKSPQKQPLEQPIPPPPSPLISSIPISPIPFSQPPTLPPLLPPVNVSLPTVSSPVIRIPPLAFPPLANVFPPPPPLPSLSASSPSSQPPLLSVSPPVSSSPPPPLVSSLPPLLSPPSAFPPLANVFPPPPPLPSLSASSPSPSSSQPPLLSVSPPVSSSPPPPVVSSLPPLLSPLPIIFPPPPDSFSSPSPSSLPPAAPASSSPLLPPPPTQGFNGSVSNSSSGPAHAPAFHDPVSNSSSVPPTSSPSPPPTLPSPPQSVAPSPTKTSLVTPPFQSPLPPNKNAPPPAVALGPPPITSFAPLPSPPVSVAPPPRGLRTTPSPPASPPPTPVHSPPGSSPSTSSPPPAVALAPPPITSFAPLPSPRFSPVSVAPPPRGLRTTPPPPPTPVHSPPGSSPSTSSSPPSLSVQPPSEAASTPRSSSSSSPPTFPPVGTKNSSTVFSLPPRTAAAPLLPPRKPTTKKSFAPAPFASLAVSPVSGNASTRPLAAQAPLVAPQPTSARPQPPALRKTPVAPPTASEAPIAKSNPPAPLSALAGPPARMKPPAMVFPSPPNAGCAMVCSDPSVTTLPGTKCGCVIPMRVGLALQIPFSSFLSLLSELAMEIAAGVYLQQKQVQVAGASAGESSSFTETKLNLVPLGNVFNNQTAFRIAKLFWGHQVPISEEIFVNYTVLYVIYPGLPPFSSQNVNKRPPTNGRFPEQPLGVDIFARKNRKLHPGIIAIITLASVFLAIVCVGLSWLLIVRKRHRVRGHSPLTEAALESCTATKRSTLVSSSSRDSTSVSMASSFVPYVSGSVRTFSLAEMTAATDNFNPSNVIGEGGFGRVYLGVLADATKIAVKILIRDDQQGDREFSAEVEMLSRLHHRNLVKLVGICTDDDMRCLVYELVPNGSVDSHLHGDDAPLSWEARLKIALGAARGLAYLHEDSYPRVIHRDFKSSNILLETDFTPKVSDFGLAKAAAEELTGHISTRVMGTFGYVAPEYAMTGHLLVKSDVYSYGVVLLELLSGRKPVDMSRLQGQENLVTWARPLLSSMDGLDFLVDPALRSSVVLENFSRVAAIASMCVQPEVSQRPFMGEVVQALKLVCNDMDVDEGETSGATPDNANGNVSLSGTRTIATSQRQQNWDFLYRSDSDYTPDEHHQQSFHHQHQHEQQQGQEGNFSASSALLRQFSPSFGRHSASEPLKKFFNPSQRFLTRSVSEHGMHSYDKESRVWP